MGFSVLHIVLFQMILSDTEDLQNKIHKIRL